MNTVEITIRYRPMAPLHVHAYDEELNVRDCRLTVYAGGTQVELATGQSWVAPAGVPHTYRYLGKSPGRLMCVITPSGFEGFFAEIGVLTPQQQQNIPRVIELAKKYGLEILPRLTPS